MTETATETTSDTRPSTNHPQGVRTYGYAEALELQRIIMQRVRNPKTDSLRIAALANAWDKLEDRKRVLKMRPKPADMPVDPAALLKALKRAKVRAGGQGSIQRLLKEAEPIIESEPDEPPAHT